MAAHAEEWTERKIRVASLFATAIVQYSHVLAPRQSVLPIVIPSSRKITRL